MPTMTDEVVEVGSLTLEDGVTLHALHAKDTCRGEFCWVHRPSQHSMRGFPRHWRADRGLLERICPHGIGHPDPDQYMPDFHFIHGCDGCCSETTVAGGPID